jgi:hypothetical protein
MERVITTIHGMGTIIIPGMLPGDGGFIIIHGPAGDFHTDTAMDGLAGDFIHTEEVTGVREDTTGVTDMAIIADTGEDVTRGTNVDTRLDSAIQTAIQTAMYITIEVPE